MSFDGRRLDVELMLCRDADRNRVAAVIDIDLDPVPRGE
jgi:hypothetical protein